MSLGCFLLTPSGELCRQPAPLVEKVGVSGTDLGGSTLPPAVEVTV